ncbi:ABC transporter permease [Sphingobacterium spiritivorum]|uniref:ABC transporter permease n=1 Tax=Sphingobacterium spiritivorum TaxID=258 RepID=UPI003DA52867
MNKVLLIIKREYFSRVKKKSFLLLTFLVPLFFIGMYVLIFYLTKKSFEDSHATVYVIDNEGNTGALLKSNKNITYIESLKSLQDQKKDLDPEKGNSGILIIPKDFYKTTNIEYLTIGKAGVSTQSEIENQLEEIVRNYEYKEAGIDIKTLDSIRPKINLVAKELTETGSEKASHTEVAMGIAMGLSILIYISLFLYGAQVMRGIIEEKSSRIVEVIISSVKPFQLMLGKIIGIGMVGLTQFILWLLLTVGLTTIATSTMLSKEDLTGAMNSQGQAQQLEAMNSSGFNFQEAMQSVNFPQLIICFFIFFIGGYLLYSALFAAAGSAVESETEASQFTMPITMPLLLTYILSFGVLVNDPNGPVATWLSFIPLTSPIAMLVRIPFGVPTWQIIVSALLLVGGFLLTTWVAARIYRVGILMYGKKASFKEMIKWFNYKR